MESTPSRPSPASTVRDGQHVQTDAVSPHKIANPESKSRELEVKLQLTKLECRYRDLQTQIETETRVIYIRQILQRKLEKSRIMYGLALGTC